MMMLIDNTQNQCCLTPPTNIICASRITSPDYIYSVYVKLSTLSIRQIRKTVQGISFRKLRIKREKEERFAVEYHAQ